MCFKLKAKLSKKLTYLKASSKLLQLDSTMSGGVLVSFVPAVFLPVILIRLAGTNPDLWPSTVARSQPLKYYNLIKFTFSLL